MILDEYELILVGLGREWADSNHPKVKEAYQILANILKSRNYFVVTVNYDDAVYECGLLEQKITAPCGSMKRYQCENGCETIFGDSPLDHCPICNGAMIPNNIQADWYNEHGYLTSWTIYTKWLERTLNHKLLILELGVDFFAPTVIRFPFEKTAFYNQKADFYRINQSIYQLPENASKEHAFSINQNAIDWVINEWGTCK